MKREYIYGVVILAVLYGVYVWYQKKNLTAASTAALPIASNF